MRPDSGRVVVVQAIPTETFCPFQLGDRFLHREFLEEGPGFPAWRRLPARLRQVLVGLAPGAVLDPTQRTQMTVALEAMLEDQKLFWEINDHHNARVGVASELARFLRDDEVRLVQWLVLHCDGQGIFRKPLAALTPDQRAAPRTLNMLALAPYFDRARPGSGFEMPCTLCLGEPSITSLMKRAG